MTRVAAVDCGTNTIKLLVADLDPATGEGLDLVREMRMVRLGQDVDSTGRLAPEALARTFAAVEEYAALVAEHDVAVLRFCATSAARDATNADEFTAGVRQRMGVDPEVVSGDEEARLAYLGATRTLLDGEHHQPFLVVDIGGGSTELILGSGTEVEAGRSLDIGSVRMTERHLVGDPPTHAQVEDATAAIDEALDELAAHGVDPARGRTVVGVAGTITTVAAAVLDLPEWDYDAIHHADLARADVHATTARLLAMTYDERRALPYMHPGRADVIGAGALILDRVLARTASDRLLVSQTDILDGIAWSVA